MKSKYILPLFLLLQIIFLKIIPFYPEFIEKYYSTDLYLKIASFSRITFGRIPFSIGDCIYFILIVLFIKWIWTKRKSWKLLWKDNLLTALSFLSVFYFLFHFLWAFNYYRVPLFEKMGIQREYSDGDLLDFTKKLITKTNSIQYQITKNNNLKVKSPFSQEQLFKMNLNGYSNLATEHPYFSYSHLSIKKSLFSLPLTYMGFGGYLNPFTNEAQVNDLGPLYSFPMTANHEMAHQMGYASESECNFIGFLASIKNDNLHIQYSGYSMALRYCLGIIRAKDEKLFNQIVKAVHPGILNNYKESQDFWKQYETFIEVGFHIFYDNFLKMNQQKDGMDSYSRFVDLMINYYKEKEL